MLCGDVECGCALTSGNINVSGSGIPGDPWVLTANDLQVVSVATMPSSPSVGNQVYQFDTGRFLIYDGSNWVITGGVWPQVHAGHAGGSQFIPTTTFTFAVWNAVRLDTAGFTTPSSDTVTIPSGMGGRYHWAAGVNWRATSGASGYRDMVPAVDNNGGTDTVYNSGGQSSFPSVGITNRLSGSRIMSLLPGATVQILCRQGSGDPLELTEVNHQLVMYEHHPEWQSV